MTLFAGSSIAHINHKWCFATTASGFRGLLNQAPGFRSFWVAPSFVCCVVHLLSWLRALACSVWSGFCLSRSSFFLPCVSCRFSRGSAAGARARPVSIVCGEQIDDEGPAPPPPPRLSVVPTQSRDFGQASPNSEQRAACSAWRSTVTRGPGGRPSRLAELTISGRSGVDPWTAPLGCAARQPLRAHRASRARTRSALRRRRPALGGHGARHLGLPAQWRGPGAGDGAQLRPRQRPVDDSGRREARRDGGHWVAREAGVV